MFSPPSTENWKTQADQAGRRGLKPPRNAPPFRDFAKAAWHVVDPGIEILWGWHLDAICDHLQAVRDGNIQNLIINIPPGHAKSVLISVLWPAWMWLDRPEWRALFSSYDQMLVVRDALRCREVLESEWYQKEFSPPWRLKADQNTKTFYKNTKQGFRFCHTVGGRGTGHRGDTIVCDDPLNARERHSIKKRERMLDWWRRTMPTRLNDPRTGQKVIIMQRLHEEDLTAEALRQGGYIHLNLMSQYVPERRCVTVIKPRGSDKEQVLFEDPRTERGELLFPKLFTQEVLDGLKAQLGEEDFEAQHQQNPTPQEGGMFKEHFWEYWCFPGQKLRPVRIQLASGEYLEKEAVPLDFATLERQIQSWDLTFKAKKTSDYVVGEVWGIRKADRFLLWLERDRLGFDDTVAAIKRVSLQWPEAFAKFVEDKANGSAILDHLGSEVSGLIAVEPRGDKMERAWAIQPQVRSGNVYLPHPDLYKWVEQLRNEFKNFPNATNDDCVDAASQALDQIEFEKQEDVERKPAYNPADALAGMVRPNAPARPANRSRYTP